MNPKVYEFQDITKAISYYKVMVKKLEECCSLNKRIWFEVTMQTSNLTGVHLVTIHIGVQKEKDDNKDIQDIKGIPGGMFDF